MNYRAALVRIIVEAADPLLRARWQATLTQPHEIGATGAKPGRTRPHCRVESCLSSGDLMLPLVTKSKPSAHAYEREQLMPARAEDKKIRARVYESS